MNKLVFKLVLAATLSFASISNMAFAKSLSCSVLSTHNIEMSAPVKGGENISDVFNISHSCIGGESSTNPDEIIVKIEPIQADATPSLFAVGNNVYDENNRKMPAGCNIKTQHCHYQILKTNFKNFDTKLMISIDSRNNNYSKTKTVADSFKITYSLVP